MHRRCTHLWREGKHNIQCENDNQDYVLLIVDELEYKLNLRFWSLDVKFS